jgi:hypothetical protein
MRAFAAGLVLLAGCAEISGLGNLEVCDGACVDATADVTVQQDSAAEANNADANDSSTTVDAPILPDGADGGPSITCTRPADCKQGDFCCGTVNTGGRYPNCTISNVATTCTQSCTTMLAGQKCEKNTVRMCEAGADCTEQLYNRCCKFPYGANASISVCSNTLVAEAGGGTCP